MIDRELLTSKMESMHGYLVELGPLLAKDIHDIVSDTLVLRSVERLFQLVVDTAAGN